MQIPALHNRQFRVGSTRGRTRRLVVIARGFTPNHISLDVEYAHYRIQNVAERLCPAEVCLVDWHGKVVYHSYCQRDVARAGEKWTGGVPIGLTQDANPLKLVSAKVQAHIKDRVLVGHGLQNDLSSLGVKQPLELLRDTIKCPPLQRNGYAQSLKLLAQTHLGLEIQRGSSLHSAREDAEAIMKLYRHIVEKEPTEAATPDEMLEVYLYLHSLEKKRKKEPGSYCQTGQRVTAQESKWTTTIGQYVNWNRYRTQ